MRCKGIIAAQITAAEQLRKEGIEDIGLLYTVEEERSSTGAKAANMHPLAAKCEYMINGEPTDNDLAIGSKGTFRLNIKTTGKAAHSAYPEEGDSAIEKLLDILDDIRHTRFPNDEFFGDTTVNIGTIEGGAALNVISPTAEAGLAISLTTKSSRSRTPSGASFATGARSKFSRSASLSEWSRSMDLQRKSFDSQRTYPTCQSGKSCCCSGPARYSLHTRTTNLS